MKSIINFFLVLIFLLQGFNLISQPIDTLDNYFVYQAHMIDYFQNQAQEQHINYYEVDGWKQFMRWSFISENRYDEYGNMTPYAEALEEYYSLSPENTLENLPNWEYIGHEGIYPMQNGTYWHGVGQGNINTIWVDENDLNHIIAGGNYGSLWRTTDGGNNWVCISDTEPLLDGFRSIEVDENDHNKIFVVQGYGNYSNGLFYTTDGGATWNNNKVYITASSSYLYPNASAKNIPRKWILHPLNNSIMYLMTWGKVLRSIDGGNNWDVLLDQDFEFWTNNQSFNDMEFDPIDPSILYVGGSKSFKITNNGNTIMEITSQVTQYSEMVAFYEPFQNSTIPPGWSISGPQDWLFTTSWPDYGASGLEDHTGTNGSFAGVDGSGSTNITDITLESPFIDVSSLISPQLRFFLFNNNVNNSDWQSLRVDFFDGANWNESIFVWDGTMNNANWVPIAIRLGSYEITGDVKFRFVVDKSSGSPIYDDLIIDDVYVEEGRYKVLVGTRSEFPDKIWFAVNSWGGDDALLYYDNNSTQQDYHLLKAAPDLLDELKMQCEISPINENHIFIGGTPSYLYDHATGNNYEISKDDIPYNWTHVDVRDAKYLVDENDNEVIIVGNDGSVFRADMNTVSDWNWTYLGNDGSNGIQNCHLHGFDCSNTTTDILFEGLQDMATAVRLDGQWYGHWAYGTGDGGLGVIDKTDPKYMYISGWNSPAKFDRTTDGGLNWTPFFSNNDHAKPPVLLNPSNPDELFIGDVCKIYKFPHARTSNSNTTILSIINDGNGAGDLNFNDIAISESNDDIIFASTGRYWPGWAGSQLYEKSLFKTTDGGQNWIDITSNLVDTNAGLDAISSQPITGISINPWNSDEVWACFGNISNSPDANINKKVYHSIDGGQTWGAIANGLPEKIPANELYFDKRGNTLYLATDVGLYYYDTDEDVWYNIINNGPSTYILQIRFNYALNKIRIGTHGRGIWQAEIPCFNTGEDTTINTNVLWDTPKHIYGNIHIEYGGTLTITNEVYMAEGNRIVVEQGGKLLLDGGIITNTCGNYWYGIEVWGDPSFNQNPVDQGWVKIQNGGTIMNSRQGVVASLLEEDPTDGDLTPNPAYAGGIIQASDAHFINNQTAIQFYDYPHTSVSYFNNCQFKLDWNYFGTEEPENYMVIDNMTGVDVTFCNFINEKTSTAAYTGILSENSTVFIEGDCISGTMQDCDEWANGGFVNLEYGVYATAATTGRYIDIRHTDFTNNFRGVYIGGMTSPRVTSNRFFLNTPATELGYGLYLDQSTGYWVEDNLFERCDGCEDPTGIGIIVNESGRDPNQIYLNVFNYVENAINVQGKNRNGKNAKEGLVLKCNDYNETVADETIIWEPPLINSDAGIAGSQGQGTLNITDMAGNIFHYDYVPGNYDDLDNEANFFDYYYSTNAPGYNVEPMDAQFGITVNKHGKATNDIWTPETACLSTINTGGGGGGIDDDLGKMGDAQAGIETTEAVLAAMVDGGDTEALNTVVETSTQPEAVQVYTELMSESPNLSETVVESTIGQETVLPNAMVRDVMVANPHTAKSLVLLEKLDERYDPMPEYMKAQILAGRSIHNLKQELESQLAGYKLEKAIAMNNIIRYYNGQLEPQTASDSILYLYQADNTLSSSYRLAWLYFEMGEYQLGDNVMNNIPAQFTLDGDEQLEYNQMSGIYTMLSGLYENGNTIASLTASQLTELQMLAGEGTIPARAYARNILMSIGELEYEEPVLFSDPYKSSEAIAEYNNIVNTKPPQVLEIYPNPSKDYVILEYNLEKEEDCTIEISEMTGKTIQTLATSRKQDQVTIVTENWKPGTYIATLFIQGKVIESCKFSITK